MKNVVIWGAGRAGRGYLGQAFSENAAISFVDKNTRLVEMLHAQGRYSVKQKPIDAPPYTDVVANFDAHVAGSDEAVECVVHADIVALCIFPEDMPEAVAALVPALCKRMVLFPEQPLDILICANAVHFAPVLREMFMASLPEAARAWFVVRVGLVETMMRRICVSPSREAAEKDSLAIVTNVYPTLVADASSMKQDYSEFPFIEKTADMHREEERKLYTYNLVHATYAYVGYAHGCRYTAESRDNAEIQALAERVYRQSSAALRAKYKGIEQDLDKDEPMMWKYMVNPAIPDRVERICFDPMRKLGRNERIIGPCLMCLENGIFPDAILEVAAYALRYDAPSDPAAQHLQLELAKHGIEKVLDSYCGLADEPLLAFGIATAYRGHMAP